ncbi:MAG: hypothetical protein ABSH53_02900 [Holophaga sp.]
MKEKTTLVAFRLPEWLIDEIDEAARNLSQEGNTKSNRTKLVQELLIQGLGKHELVLIVHRLRRAYESMVSLLEAAPEEGTPMARAKEAFQKWQDGVAALQNLEARDPGVTQNEDYQLVMETMTRGTKAMLKIFESRTP